MEQVLKILVVEDVPTDAELEVRELKRAGLRVSHRIVDTEKGFREALTQFRPELIISDFSMPQFDGMWALALARELAPDIPFIFVSGTIGEEYAIRALKNGATDYVLKSNLVRLPAAVERALQDSVERAARLRAERDLEETRNRLDGIVSSLSDVIWSVSRSPYQVLFVSRAFETVWGVSSEEIYKNPQIWMDKIHPDDRKYVETVWQKALQGGLFDVVYRIVRSGNTVRWMHDRAKPIYDDSGNVTRLDGIARDITDIKLQEQRISRLSRIRAVSGGINSAIVRIRDRQQLLEEACRIAVEYGGFGIAWIGLLEQESMDIVPAACSGVDAESLMATSRNSARADSPRGQGMVGKSLREKRAVFSNDLTAELDKGGVRRQEAIKRGYRSLISLPLITGEQLVGVISLLIKETNFFDDEEIKLLTELADNISFALEHIRKAEALSETEKKLDSILGTLQEVVWSMDPRSGRILYLNAAVRHLTRRPISDFVNQSRSWRRLIHREDRIPVQMSIRELLREGRLNHEFRIVLADGDVRTVESSARVTRDSREKAVRIDGTISDITERVRAEALQKKHYKLAQLQAAMATAANEALTQEGAFRASLKLIGEYGGWRIAHMAIFSPNSQGKYSAVSSLWEADDLVYFEEFVTICERHDYTIGKRLVGKAIQDKSPVWIEDLAVIGPGRRNSVAVAKGLRSAFAFPVVLQNNVVAVLEFYASDVRPPDSLLMENVASISGQLERVIERARASEIHTRLAAIVESSQDAIVSSSPDGKILTWNAGAEKMFGYSGEEVQGRDLAVLVPEQFQQNKEYRNIGYRSNGIFELYESEGVTKSGQMIAVSVHPSPLKDGAGNLVGIATIFRDITARISAETNLRRLNEELEDKVAERTADLLRARHEAEEANRAKSSFLAAMSHEIRTPMNGVIGMVDVLHQTSIRGDQVEMVDLIRESAFSLLGIIDDILDFSKIEAGKLDLEHQPIAIRDVVENVCSMLDRLAQKTGVELTVFVDPNIPLEVMGDGLRLRQVLINLANNAIKFSGRQSNQGQVSVRALLVESDENKVIVELRVADNGIGMDEAAQARLFTAFTQADVSTTRRFGGTGLGLVIANHLVGLMGGGIKVVSAPGEGSVFSVRLPFVTLPTGTNIVESKSDVAGLSCVVVGNAGGIADDLAAYLAHASAFVARASDVAGAGRLAARQPTSISVWVIDARDEVRNAEQMRAAISSQLNQDIRFVVVLIGRGKRRRIRTVIPDLIAIDGNALSRRNFLRAVATAAGRASLETETPKTLPNKVVATPSREEALRNGRLILVAEDNETNQKVILRQLALLGYMADIASDGREALERWSGGEYALLFTDLHMPVMDGYELTKAIRAAEEDIGAERKPIVTLTANALKGEAEQCLAAGMDGYLSKPSPLADLKAILEKWLPEKVSSDHSGADTDGANGTVPVDVHVLESLVGDDPDVIRDFLQDFGVRLAKTTKEMHIAYKDMRIEQVSALAHQLKSAARSTGAIPLGEVCARIEEIRKDGKNNQLQVLMRQLDEQVFLVDKYLKSL